MTAQTVVLDTNALLMPFEMKMNIDISVSDLLGEVRFVVPGPIVGELKHLDNKYAKAALELARRCEIIPTSATGDRAVMELAIKTGGYVLTNDKELRGKLRKLGVPLIYLRSGTHLVVESPTVSK
jgi:rRNA-processing protein FCF1